MGRPEVMTEFLQTAFDNLKTVEHLLLRMDIWGGSNQPTADHQLKTYELSVGISNNFNHIASQLWS